MGKDPGQFRTQIFWPIFVGLLAFAAFRIGYLEALLSDVEQAASGAVAGTWEVMYGTGLEATLTGEGYLEAESYGVRGEICVKNNGERPTEGLAIIANIQYKSAGEKFQNYISTEVNPAEKSVLEAGESHCYPYNIPFERLQGEKVHYRNLVNVTISNHAGWLPGTEHCQASAPCPFGPNPKAEFELPEPVVRSTTLQAEQTASGFLDLNNKGEAFYGAKGKVCVTNKGEYPTEGLSIHASIENRVGGKYIEMAAQVLNTNEQPVIEPGESHCYELEMAFPDPDENLIEPRVTTSITIHNYTAWMPGDASCPGPEACYHGPTVETYFELAADEVELTPEVVEMPRLGANLTATGTAIGFVEKREGELASGVRGEVCVTNEGPEASTRLSITNSIQVKEGDTFTELKAAALDLGDSSALDAGSQACFPYEILFEPQADEHIEYRSLATVTFDNHTDWLPGEENCPGEDVCPFVITVPSGFTLPTDSAPGETTETEPPAQVPTETETPVPETPETETPTSEPTETETPTPEPAETETSIPESVETETPEPIETETPEPEITETETPTPESAETEPGAGALLPPDIPPAD